MIVLIVHYWIGSLYSVERWTQREFARFSFTATHPLPSLTCTTHTLHRFVSVIACTSTARIDRSSVARSCHCCVGCLDRDGDDMCSPLSHRQNDTTERTIGALAVSRAARADSQEDAVDVSVYLLLGRRYQYNCYCGA